MKNKIIKNNMKKILILTIMITFLSINSLYGEVINKSSEVTLKTKDIVKPKIFSKKEIKIKKYIEQNIIDRFKIFKGNIKTINIYSSKKLFTVTGRLVSPTGTPMDLVGKFCEALQNCKKFDSVIPSIIKKENVEEQNKVYFVITIDGNDKKIKNSEIISN